MNSPWHQREGRQLRAPMASVSLVSSPPAPVLDKNMTDSELAGDGRSSNILMRFFLRSSVRFSVVGRRARVAVFSLTMSRGAGGSAPSTRLCMPLWCS